MSSSIKSQNRIAMDDRIIAEARAVFSTQSSRGMALVLKKHDGTEIALPEKVAGILMSTLAALSEGEPTSILRVPDELTSTAAAEILGVSRPTLMKWADQKKISTFDVGTHRRFLRKEVLELKEKRREDRLRAFEELRVLDKKLGIED